MTGYLNCQPGGFKMQKKLLFLDIETIPNEKFIKFLPEPEPPKNYKDLFKIAEWIETKKQEFINKMALDIDFAKIVAIGLAVNFDNPGVNIARDEENEKKILEWFWQLVAESHILVGFNNRSFDLPVILRRSFLLDVQPTRILNLSRYSNGEILDLMKLLYHEGYASGPMARGLKVICQMFGIPNPLPDKDGSMVKDMSDEELVMYCANDVKMTQELARRACGYYWED